MRNRGITLLEIIISLGLVSIFSIVIFPTLKVSNNINREIIQKSLLEKDSERILNIIERSIEKSTRVKENYQGKEYIKNGVGVILEGRYLNNRIDIDTLSNNSKSGNFLFLEYPRSNGNRVDNSILVFHFLNNSLRVIHAKVLNNSIKIIDSNILCENVLGEFERTETGIIINYEVLSKKLIIKEKIKGYGKINL